MGDEINNSEFGMRNSELNVSPSGTYFKFRKPNLWYCDRSYNGNTIAPFSLQPFKSVREADTIIPNSEFRIPNSQ